MAAGCSEKLVQQSVSGELVEEAISLKLGVIQRATSLDVNKFLWWF
jgi:hypothetical protein